MENLIALAVASAVLVAIPGPNVALTVANSLRYGFGAGVLTSAGAACGIGLQLALVVVGMAALVEVAASALLWVKWLGVIYLVVLGVLTWRQPAGDLAGTRARPVFFGAAVLVAVTNPKTLLFNAAFLPQFVPADASVAELLAAATVMLAVIFAGDTLWALCASRARTFLMRYARARNRIAGLFLVTAGASLALARR